jgi:hypothetical protein
MEVAMTALDNRATAFEAGFVQRQGNRFRIESRRNRLFGEWAALLLGLQEAAAERYIQQIVDTLVEPATGIPTPEEHVISKVYLDLISTNWDMTPEEVRGTLIEFEDQAHREILGNPRAQTPGGFVA